MYDEIKALETALSNRLPEGFLCTVELDEEIGIISVYMRLMRGGKIESFTYYISQITLQYLSIDQIVNIGFDFEHPLLDWIRKVEEEANDVINEKKHPGDR